MISVAHGHVRSQISFADFPAHLFLLVLTFDDLGSRKAEGGSEFDGRCGNNILLWDLYKERHVTFYEISFPARRAPELCIEDLFEVPGIRRADNDADTPSFFSSSLFGSMASVLCGNTCRMLGRRHFTVGRGLSSRCAFSFSLS